MASSPAVPVSSSTLGRLLSGTSPSGTEDLRSSEKEPANSVENSHRAFLPMKAISDLFAIGQQPNSSYDEEKSSGTLLDPSAMNSAEVLYPVNTELNPHGSATERLISDDRCGGRLT